MQHQIASLVLGQGAASATTDIDKHPGIVRGRIEPIEQAVAVVETDRLSLRNVGELEDAVHFEHQPIVGHRSIISDEPMGVAAASGLCKNL